MLLGAVMADGWLPVGATALQSFPVLHLRT